ncbi:hypothetical protein [Nostoc sp. UHCC 0302]
MIICLISKNAIAIIQNLCDRNNNRFSRVINDSLKKLGSSGSFMLLIKNY